MRAEHINITIPIALKHRIDEESKRERIGRSTLIQKAVKLYLDLVKKKAVRKMLIEGYAEISGEARRIADEFDSIDVEALKYVD